MRTPLFFSKILVGLMMMFCVSGIFAQDVDFSDYSIAFVHGPNPDGDDAVVAFLEEAMEGITITRYQEGTADLKTTVADYDLVIVSSTISSGSVEGWFDLAKPLITWESYALPRLRMVAGTGELNYGNVGLLDGTENAFEFIKVSTDPRAVSLGLTAGKTDEFEAFTGPIRSGAGANSGVFAFPNENAIVILTYDWDEIIEHTNTDWVTGLQPQREKDMVAAFVFEAGAIMDNEYPAPAKRGFYFFHDSSPAVASEDTWDVFEAMVLWSMDLLEGEGPVNVERLPNANNEVKVFPNPVTQKATVFVKVDRASDLTVEVTDLTGRIILSQKHFVSGSRNIELDVEGLRNGIYMVRVQGRDMQKVVKMQKQ
jgi:hypothetical protein